MELTIICVFTVISGVNVKAAIQEVSVNSRQPHCSSWGEMYPYTNGVDSDCHLAVSLRTKHKFLEAIKHGGYDFFTFHLEMEYNETVCALQGNKWSWTFPGPHGGLYFINWPVEYGIWSLGFLSSKTLYNFPVSLELHGNCSIVVGTSKSMQLIALALSNLTDFAVSRISVTENNEDLLASYNKSYWCYKERLPIPSDLYALCQNFICPAERVAYRCCRWNKTRQLECSGNYHKATDGDWLALSIPFALGCILFMFFALVLMWLNASIHELTYQQRMENNEGYNRFNTAEDEPNHEKWIFYNPIHVGYIIENVFKRCCIRFPVLSSRIARACFSCLSLTLIVTKLFLMNKYLQDYIVACIQKGVPRNFESLLVNVRDGKENFLPYFGGPRIALLSYLICFLFCACIPRNLASFLAKGLPSNDSITKSPLYIDDSVKVKYGAQKPNDSANGYDEIYHTLKSHFFMVINPSFWNFAIILQYQRWSGFRHFSGRKICLLVLIPFYLILCVLELLLSLLFYSIPTLAFLFIVCRAFAVAPMNEVQYPRAVRILFSIVSLVVVMFVMYIFSLIFLESFLFLCDVILFTYIGLFVHPTVSYKTLILAVSVAFYILDCIRGISSSYDTLFYSVRKVCKKMSKYREDIGIVVYRRDYENEGIPKELFFMIVNRLKPIRSAVFMSLLKLSLIIFVLSVSINYILEFSYARNIDLYITAFATVIVGLVPKIIGLMFRMFFHKNRLKLSREIRNSIKLYCGNVQLQNRNVEMREP